MKIALILPFAALALAACDTSPTVIVAGERPDPMANQLAAAPPVELPPAIKATKTMRCKDNSLVYVDFFEGEKAANLRTEKGGTPVQLKAEAAGQPFKAEGYELTGTPASIQLTQPGKGAQSCKS